MASSPEAAQSADNSSNVSPPAADSSTSPPSLSSPPPPTPPPSDSSSPPLDSPPPPQSLDSPPPPQSPDSPPPPPQSPDSPPPPPPTIPAQSPPPNTTFKGSPPPVFSPPAVPYNGNASSLIPPPPALIHSPPPRSRSTSGSSSGSSLSKNTASSSDHKELNVILGIIFGGVVALVIIIVCLRRWSRRRNKQQENLEHGFPGKGGGQYQKGSTFASSSAAQTSQTQNVGGLGAKYEFRYEALAAATGGFCEANLLGQGGFGLVHKGVLPNGKEVAVKSLKSGSGQGEREFQAEVEIISRVHHRHLVSLVGYCIAARQRMLVYNFVPNQTLEFHLHGKEQPVMDWATRRRIAVGSAKGLAYLHEDCHPRIIHRDIKSANILLDLNFEAMVADFGLAKLTTDNHTHVSTRVMGTFGYLAPEYAASGKLSEKSDVYSFGVMLSELITGLPPIDPTNIMEDSLVDWARPIMSKALETGNYSELVDPRLEHNYNPDEMAHMISCASASTRQSARKRPRMSQIVRALDGNLSLECLNEGLKTSSEITTSNPYDTKAYDADIMKFRKMVMSSNDFDSGETS